MYVDLRIQRKLGGYSWMWNNRYLCCIIVLWNDKWVKINNDVELGNKSRIRLEIRKVKFTLFFQSQDITFEERKKLRWLLSSRFQYCSLFSLSRSLPLDIQSASVDIVPDWVTERHPSSDRSGVAQLALTIGLRRLSFKSLRLDPFTVDTGADTPRDAVLLLQRS